MPLTGEKFLRGVITPIDPRNIFFLLQAGYAPDFVLELTVESLNGLHNRSLSGGTFRPADPEFLRVVELLRLPPDEHRFVISYSPMRGGNRDLTVNSRSMLQILMAFASVVDVPEQHVRQRSASPAVDGMASREAGQVRSGTSRPKEAFTAVQ